LWAERAMMSFSDEWDSFFCFLAEKLEKESPQGNKNNNKKRIS
jgi:hypothetical protein